MKRQKFKKFVAVLMILTLLLSNMTMVFAEDTGVSANNMLSFFKEGRSNLGLNVNNISVDEAYIYGLFLSNFYMPGSTTNETIEQPELAETVSSIFFGDPAAASGDLQKINQKVAQAINYNLTTADADNFFYADAVCNIPLTGPMFVDIFTKQTNQIIYFRNTQGVIKPVDLTKEEIHSAFKIVFGIVPQLFTNKEFGINSFSAIKMDAWGNIWGQKTTSTYILIMPGALNPMVFGDKLPVTNSFAMGAFADIRKVTNSSSATTQLLPYYALSKSLGAASLTSIVAVASPHTFIGDTSKIINKGTDATNRVVAVQKFLEANNALRDGGVPNYDNITIMINANPSAEILKKISSELLATLPGDEMTKRHNANRFADYFLATTFLDPSQLEARMYYFGSSGNTEDNWNTAKLTTIDNNLLFKQQEVEGTTSIIPYTDSTVVSPLFSAIQNNKLAVGLETLSTYISTGKFAGGTSGKSAVYVQSEVFLKTLTGDKEDHPALIFGLFKPIDSIPTLVVDANTRFNPKKPETWLDNTVSKPLVYGMGKGDYAFAGAVAIADTKLDEGKIGVPMLQMLAQSMGITGNSSIIEQMYKKPFQYHQDTGTKHHTQLYDGGFDVIKGVALTATEENAVYTLFDTAYFYTLIGMENSALDVIQGGNALGASVTLHDGTVVNTQTIVANKVADYAGVYWAYMVELLGVTIEEDEAGVQKLTAKELTLPNYFPPLNASTIGLTKQGFDDADSIGGSTENGGVTGNKEESLKDSVTNLIKKVQDFLSPEPSSDRDSWLKSVITGFILQTHNDMVGKDTTSTNNLNTGKSSYVATASFLTNPNLQDIPVANWFVNNYIYIYIGLMAITGIALSLFVLSGQRKLTHSLLIFVFMGVVFLMPHTIINLTTQASNKIGNQVYSDKFDYWTLLQHQQYQKGLDNASTSEEYSLQQNSQKVTNAYGENTSVKVKWMSPKKGDAFAAIFSNATGNSTLTTNLAIFKWLFSSFIYQEEYVYDDPLATYLYRPYNAIVVTANSAFNELAKTGRLASTFTQQIKSSNIPVDSTMFTALRSMGGTVPYSDTQQYVINSVKGTNPDNNAYDYAFWGLTENTITKQIFKSRTTIEADGYDDAGFNAVATDTTMGKAFLLQTESPYYYFYNSLKARYGTGSEFKRNFIAEDFFTVTYEEIDDMNSQLMSDLMVNDVSKIGLDTEELAYATRDFLDMEGLFTYVIPYLKQSNAYVHTWGSIFGMQVDSFDFTDGSTQGDTDEERKAYDDARDKKIAVERVWNLYSPWVQALYDTSYAIDKVYVAKERTAISDAYNPDAYTDLGINGSNGNMGRSMVFSEADMLAKNYDPSMLSGVELRIQKVLKNTEKDMYYLMNYYDLDDEVLLSAAAMLATFNFNAEFSESKLVGESVNLYPVGYELKNFNYDAYMRMALMNATGEGVMDKEDLYVRILNKTSIVTGFFLLIVDFLGVIVIPTMRIMALLLLLAIGVLQSITCVLNPPDKIIKSMFKNVITPSIMFLAANIFLIWASSMFIGEGLTGYTGSRGSTMPVNDPTLTLVLLAFVSAVYAVILFKIMNTMVQTGKLLSRQAFFGGVMAVAGGVTTMTGGVLKAAGNITGGTLSGINAAINPFSAARNHQRRVQAGVKEGLKQSGLGSNKTNKPLTDAEKAQQQKHDAKGAEIGKKSKVARETDVDKAHGDALAENQKRAETAERVANRAQKIEKLKSNVVNVTGNIQAKAENIRQEANKVLSKSQTLEQAKRVANMMGDTAQGAVDTMKDKTKTVLDNTKAKVDDASTKVTASIQKMQAVVDKQVADINAKVLQPVKEKTVQTVRDAKTQTVQTIKATKDSLVLADAYMGSQIKDRLDALESKSKIKADKVRSGKYT